MSDSIAFDRAAEYYDDTRGLSEEGVRHTTEALAEVFRGGGPILEVGVGTGQVALPLHDAGVPAAHIPAVPCACGNACLAVVPKHTRHET